MGARARMTAALALVSAILLAVPAVTQPPQVKPTMASATAPIAAPVRVDLRVATLSLARSIVAILRLKEVKLDGQMAGATTSLSRRARNRVTDDLGTMR